MPNDGIIISGAVGVVPNNLGKLPAVADEDVATLIVRALDMNSGLG